VLRPHPGSSAQARHRRDNLQVVSARWCGLEVHQKTVVAWVWLTEWEDGVRKHARTFGTMTADLLALARLGGRAGGAAGGAGEY
jgi:hypothetical protein